MNNGSSPSLTVIWWSSAFQTYICIANGIMRKNSLPILLPINVNRTVLFWRVSVSLSHLVNNTYGGGKSVSKESEVKIVVLLYYISGWGTM